MDNFWSQKQAFCSFGRSFRIGVSSYRVHPVVWERVLAGGEFLAASRYVFGVEDAGSRGGDGLLEEAAIQHLHGAVHGRREHVVGRFCRRHWIVRVERVSRALAWFCRGRELLLFLVRNDALRRQS